MTLTDACCNTPPTVTQWQNKGQFQTISTKINGEERRTYRTGPKDSKRGIIAVYDIFSYHPTGLQFFDLLAEKGFQVSVPEFFPQGGISDEQFGSRDSLLAWIGANGDYKKNHIGELIKAAVKDLRAEGCTTFSLVGQCWGVLMAATAVSEEGHGFVSAGGVHPSFISIETVKDVRAPLILLPSKDDPDMVPVLESIKHNNFEVESLQQRFDTVHHGWTGGRGDFSIPEQRKAALQALDLLADFYHKAAAVADVKEQ